jgi:hypothetical protein
MKNVIRLGDFTSHGGKVIAASGTAFMHGNGAGDAKGESCNRKTTQGPCRHEDRRVEFTDVTGETAPVKLRARITDPRMKGPIETGWGATDYTQQEAQRILLTVPASP